MSTFFDIASLGFGASLVEKHIVLDRSKKELIGKPL